MGKGRFLNVTICVVKLRNFESFHRGNATKRSRGCIISSYRLLLLYDGKRMCSNIISLDVGWLALLILETGQCEGLTTGIGAEEKLPRLFISTLNLLLKC